MRRTSKFFLMVLAGSQLSTFGLRGDSLYQLDNNSISTVINASEGTEPLDNWFGNVFTASAGSTLINRVDFGVFTTSPGSAASVSIYRVTGAGGNPALGATRLFTQAFAPLTGDGTNAFLQQISLTSPVLLNAGDKFLVSVLIRDVIAAPPNDVYPYLLDTSGSAAGSYWDRSAPNTFDLDNLSGAVTLNKPLISGGYVPGADHVIIRAFGTSVPEPSTFALCGLAIPMALGFKRRSKNH
jgi:hypothetical protein